MITITWLESGYKVKTVKINIGTQQPNIPYWNIYL